MKKMAMIFRRNFKRGLVKAVLEVTDEDEAVLTLSVRTEAETRLRNQYEKEGEEKCHKEWGTDDPDKYADVQIENDKKEAEYSARDWAEEQLSLKNIKKKIRIVWTEE